MTHLLLWTLTPTLTNENLPLDTIEALAWGSNLDWGLISILHLVHLQLVFYQIFGNQDWAYYLLSQIFVILSFIVIFKFAEDFFDNIVPAFISIILLEGVYFYNFPPEFNVNISQLPFWALSIFYMALRDHEKTLDYIFLGLSVGFGFYLNTFFYI